MPCDLTIRFKLRDVAASPSYVQHAGSGNNNGFASSNCRIGLRHEWGKQCLEALPL